MQERLEKLHKIDMPNHYLNECKKALLKKYNAGVIFKEYDIHLLNMLCELEGR